jgi:thiol-disulfide isomerase/thioredoxin
MVLVAGATAVAAGVGAALWQTRRSTEVTDAGIWSMRFDAPEGESVAMSDWRGKPMLLNFWATWCPPCVTELPLLDRFQREQPPHGWQMVGLAVDNREPVREFLRRKPVGFPIGLAGVGGVELARALGNSGGGLPFSVIFSRAGVPVQRKLGIIGPDDLTRWAGSIP